MTSSRASGGLSTKIVALWAAIQSVNQFRRGPTALRYDRASSWFRPKKGKRDGFSSVSSDRDANDVN
jgi:hypothetical protein